MRHARQLSILGVLIASAAVLPSLSCGSDTTGQGANTSTSNGGTGNGGTGTGNSGNTAGGGTGASASTGTAGSGNNGGGGTNTGSGATGGTVFIVAECAGHLYECGDTIDNDGDGLTDWTDPDCLGPCDNTEGGYFNGIPGGDGPPCEVECYWDSNSGSGNDDCHWTHECDPNEEMDPGHPEPNSSCPYDPNANLPGTNLTCDILLMMQSDTCATVCGPLTPNGCDCFGCCELPAGSGKFIFLGSVDEATDMGSCFQDVIDDVDKCEPCIPVPSCYNDCQPCELCIGKDPEDIPPECNEGGSGGAGPGGGGTGGSPGSKQCPGGEQPCGLPGQPICGPGFYCVTGCCQPIEEPP